MSSILVNGSSYSTEGLPKQFVTSLRILFDILDEDRSGYVRLRDIESRWHEEGVSGLPSGVIDSLRKVAPRNGRLTFENFVTGLKLSLLKNTEANFKQDFSQSQKRKDGSLHHTRKVGDVNIQKQDKNRQVAHPPDYVNIGTNGQVLQTDRTIHNHNVHNTVQKSQPKMGSQAISSNTAAVRPNNVLHVQSQNIELRNQIYTREQKQQATVKTHVKTDHYHTNIERNQNLQPPSYHHRHSTDGNQVRNEQSKPAYRPKSALAHTDNRRYREVNFSDVPTGRPDRPPPYRRPQDKQEVPPVLPPKNINGRIMNELKNWHKEHQVSPPSQKGSLHTVHSDSKLTDHNQVRKNEIYGRYIMLILQIRFEIKFKQLTEIPSFFFQCSFSN